MRSALALAALLATFVAGWLVNGWRLSGRVIAAETSAQLSAQALVKQNAAARTSAAKLAELQRALDVALAREPEVQTRTIERVKTITQSVPVRDATCEEVMRWQRDKFNELAQRFSQHSQ